MRRANTAPSTNPSAAAAARNSSTPRAPPSSRAGAISSAKPTPWGASSTVPWCTSVSAIRRCTSSSRDRPRIPRLAANTANRRAQSATSLSAAPRRAVVRSRDRPSRAEGAGDHHLLHLVGALADREDLGVAVEPAHRVLLDVAVAAVDLNGFLGAAHGQPAGLELRLRGGQRERALGVLEPRGLVREQSRRLDLGRHVRE